MAKLNHNHDNIREFCAKITQTMLDHQCFMYVANGKLYINDRKNSRDYECCEFYDGMHFADLSTYTDQEIEDSVMNWK